LPEVTDIFQDAVTVVIKTAGPILLLGMIVGLLTALFQAVTQIHEQSLAFILKITVVILFLALGGGWMLENLQTFTRQLFALM